MSVAFPIILTFFMLKHNLSKVSKHKKTSHTRNSRGHLKATRRFDKDKHEIQKAKRIHKISTVLEQSVRNYWRG